LDFGDFSGNLPENHFEWYIGYLNDGTYKLEISFYCEYLENTTSYNCTADTENIFTVSTIPETPAFEISVMIVSTLALLLLYKHKKR
jgi:hypothetical protein